MVVINCKEEKVLLDEKAYKVLAEAMKALPAAIAQDYYKIGFAEEKNHHPGRALPNPNFCIYRNCWTFGATLIDSAISFIRAILMRAQELVGL